MNTSDHWAVVLAAGDGSRLARLTRDARGRAVPKQFCSLSDRGSLLHDALQRAGQIVPRDRVCVVVARDHERFWRRAFDTMPGTRLFIQPRNCGTANGILLAALRIAACDPRARILFLPADHYVQDENALAGALRRALDGLETCTQDLLLIGLTPDAVDSELGYLIPGEPAAGGRRAVARFIEKPSAAVARELIARGALWNSFIFAGRAVTLLALLRRAFPEIVAGMQSALEPGDAPAAHTGALEAFYRDLPTIDFSRHVLERAETRLAVVNAPACGWTDLGTPARVLDAMTRLDVGKRTGPGIAPPAIVDLSVLKRTGPAKCPRGRSAA